MIKNGLSIKSRFGLLFYINIIMLLSFFLLRVFFLTRSWPEIPHTIGSFLYVFSIGLLFDIVFCIYADAALAGPLLIIPNKIYTHIISRVFHYSIFGGLIALTVFSSVAEWLFWDEFEVRLNFIAVDYLVYTHEVTLNIIQSYPIPAIFIGIFIIAVLTTYFSRKKLSFFFSVSEKFTHRLVYFFTFILFAFLSYLSVGQSLRAYSDNNYVNELASNGPYQFFAAFRNSAIDYKHFYAQGDDTVLSDKLKQILGVTADTAPLYDISREVIPNTPERKLNVILISVESLGAEFFTRFGNPYHLTPFLDTLFQRGLLFTDFYATGTRTTRGLEAITLSVPPTPGRSLVKRPDNKGFYNLGGTLKEHGYDAVFLYGGHGFFDNMNAFFSGNGYRIIDQSDFTDDEVTFSNAWGVVDDDLYRKAIKEANKIHAQGNPFFFHIMTTTNHRPYTYPDGKIDIPSGTGRAGAVKYTDYALCELFSMAKKQTWFDSTLFVIVADHCSGSAGKIGLPIEKYHIPLFVYAPMYIQPAEIGKISSQMDIAPTVLSILGINYKSWFFGQDILSSKFTERALIGNYQKVALYKNNELVILAPRKEISIIKNPKQNQTKITSGQINDSLVLEAMAYYQGANYIITHRMNREQ